MNFSYHYTGLRKSIRSFSKASHSAYFFTLSVKYKASTPHLTFNTCYVTKSSI